MFFIIFAFYFKFIFLYSSQRTCCFNRIKLVLYPLLDKCFLEMTHTGTVFPHCSGGGQCPCPSSPPLPLPTQSRQKAQPSLTGTPEPVTSLARVLAHQWEVSFLPIDQGSRHASGPPASSLSSLSVAWFGPFHTLPSQNVVAVRVPKLGWA